VGKYISLANALSVLLVSIAFAAFLLAQSAMSFQRRAAQYAYVDFLLATAKQLDDEFDLRESADWYQICRSFASDDTESDCTGMVYRGNDFIRDAISNIKMLNIVKYSLSGDVAIEIIALRLPTESVAAARIFAETSFGLANITLEMSGYEYVHRKLSDFKHFYFIKPTQKDRGPAFLVGITNDKSDPFIFAFVDTAYVSILRRYTFSSSTLESRPEDRQWIGFVDDANFYEYFAFAKSRTLISKKRSTIRFLPMPATCRATRMRKRIFHWRAKLFHLP
jgi:hypothetical protein